MQGAATTYNQNSTLPKPVYSVKKEQPKNCANYTYFGARYYDSDLSVWLSVDPLSDKYPSMSPYMYTAGNPVRLIDPNGMSIDDVLDGGPGKKASQQTNNPKTLPPISIKGRVRTYSTPDDVRDKKLSVTGFEPKKNRTAYDNDPGGGGGNGNSGEKQPQKKTDMPYPGSNPSETNVNLDGNIPNEVSTEDYDSKNKLLLAEKCLELNPQPSNNYPDSFDFPYTDGKSGDTIGWFRSGFPLKDPNNPSKYLNNSRDLNPEEYPSE